MVTVRIEQVRYLLHVAESGSISRSAKVLNISQQGLSQSIHQLERELGARLLYRDGNKTKLTAAGKLVKGSMEKMVNSCDEVYMHLASNAIHINHNEKQTCRVRVTPHLCITVMPAVLQRMSKVHPQLLLSVSESEILDILKVEDFDTDEVFIITCPEKFLPQLLEKKGVIDFRETSRAVINAAVHVSHPLASREKITADDLCNYPLALLGSAINVLRNVMGERFKDANVRLHTTNFELFRAAASMKEVISLSGPLAYEQADHSKLVHVPLERPETILFGYVVNRYTQNFPMAQELLGVMEDELEKTQKYGK